MGAKPFVTSVRHVSSTGDPLVRRRLRHVHPGTPPEGRSLLPSERPPAPRSEPRPAPGLKARPSLRSLVRCDHRDHWTALHGSRRFMPRSPSSPWRRLASRRPSDWRRSASPCRRSDWALPSRRSPVALPTIRLAISLCLRVYPCGRSRILPAVAVTVAPDGAPTGALAIKWPTPVVAVPVRVE